ncbi:MAG: gliding motility-associated C-terminal domain-containing protein [Paludibacteraceae bacterium]|nr:gliding motility-associated C-terminal domain-containing protein [Paludibacteraceae bacterium]
MKKLFLILMILVSVPAFMQGQIFSVITQPSGKYTTELGVRDCYRILNPKGVDHIYIVRDIYDINMITRNNYPADWYDATSGILVAKGFNTFSPEDNGHTYIVRQNGKSESFVVFDYSRYRLDSLASLTVDLSCDETVLNLSVEPMTYVDTNHVTQPVQCQCHIFYENLEWADNGWTTTTFEDTVQFTSQQITLGKQLCPTTFILTTDSISQALYGTPDTIMSAPVQPMALAQHAQSFTTTRGSSMENEAERPIQETTVKGSAPLNILFRANPSSPVDYYNWTVYHYEDEIANRTESELRFTFEEKGAYHVRLQMRNFDGCVCDTTFEDIAISESMLLVPNVFTPNGDGANDEFRVAYRSIKEFHCWVFNRWGHLVYSWDDPAKGWDGNINGRPAPEGAYYYIIRALGTDAGTDSYMSKPKYNKSKREHPENLIGVYQLSGDINLIRGGL